MSHNILFSLYSWKRGNKSFELIIKLETKPFAGLRDYYTIYFVQNKIGPTGLMFQKTISEYSWRRFSSHSKSVTGFTNSLLYHSFGEFGIKLQSLFDDFHCSKIDILGLKVLSVV